MRSDDDGPGTPDSDEPDDWFAAVMADEAQREADDAARDAYLELVQP
jgi:hypothetical protein